jgi:hypothetical protein
MDYKSDEHGHGGFTRSRMPTDAFAKSLLIIERYTGSVHYECNKSIIFYFGKFI